MWVSPDLRKFRAQAEVVKQQGLRFRSLVEDYKEACLSGYARPYEVAMCLDRVVHFFGDRRVDEIPRRMVEDYKKERSAGKGAFSGRKPVGPRTVNIELTYARKVVYWAMDDADLPISRNVFARFGMMNERATRRKVKFPTPEEFGRLLKAADPRLKPVLLTAWFAGLRLSEVVNLRKRNVSIPWNRITLEKTKNGDSRSILIHSHLLPVLAEVVKKVESSNGYLFPGRNGRPINIRKDFDQAKKAAGLPHLWFHDLRKAFVTYARGAGHDDKTVASLAGHRDLRVSDLYMVPTEAQQRAAVESIPAPPADNVQTSTDPAVSTLLATPVIS
jgi:integrase